MKLKTHHNSPRIKKYSHWQSRGFTAIELLVVISLIFILAFILLSVVPSIQKRGKAVACVANLRSVGTALGSYIYDTDASPHKRAQEIYSFLGGSVPGEDTWTNLLVTRGYIQDRKALRCPDVIPNVDITAANWFYETYGMNMVTQPDISIGENVSRDGFSGGVYRLPLSRIENPSRLIIVADSRAAMPGTNGHELQRFRLLAGTNTDAISLRHQGRANILFLDSHIESLAGQEIEALRNHPYAGVPYYDKKGNFHP